MLQTSRGHVPAEPQRPALLPALLGSATAAARLPLLPPTREQAPCLQALRAPRGAPARSSPPQIPPRVGTGPHTGLSAARRRALPARVPSPQQVSPSLLTKSLEEKQMELLAIPCKSIHPSFAAHNSPNSWVFSSSYIFFPSPPSPVTGDPNEIAEQEKASSATTRRGSSLGRGAGEHGCPRTLQGLPKNQLQRLPVPSPPNAC